jgi:cation diffusion facilitator family transporter
MTPLKEALRLTSLGVVINLALAIVKITVGVLGQSYALIADGIESAGDVLSSLVVWGGLRISLRAADGNHPYGHGKAESLAGLTVALALFGAATIIMTQSIQEIMHPQQAPAWFTLPVLAGVIALKEWLYQRANAAGRTIHSQALRNDAWHHRSDAMTSLTAFIGISIALVGGVGYESADDWAALLACGVIVLNGFRLVGPSINEVMDAAVPESLAQTLRQLAADVPGVGRIEKCRIRKSGLHHFMDIHVQVPGNLTVNAGHEIAHRVKDSLCASPYAVADVVVHIEPIPPAPL